MLGQRKLGGAFHSCTTLFVGAAATIPDVKGTLDLLWALMRTRANVDSLAFMSFLLEQDIQHEFLLAQPRWHASFVRDPRQRQPLMQARLCEPGCCYVVAMLDSGSDSG